MFFRFQERGDCPVADNRNTTVEIHIPSVLGSEKVAMDRAAAVAREMGFSENRIEDLKTAVSEACVNAIEHGNQLDESTKVGVTLTVSDSSLQVDVHDEGKDVVPTPRPDIEKKMEGMETTRGMGIFLIESLMNEVKFESRPEGGKVVKMVVYLEK